jgi:hypothetical protein
VLKLAAEHAGIPLEAIAEDNLIYPYSSAWAHSFLLGAGSYSNPGAIDERQIRAVAGGSREGSATAGNLGEKAPEIGKKLLEQYAAPRMRSGRWRTCS